MGWLYMFNNWKKRFNPEKGSFPENSQLFPAQKWEKPDIVGKLPTAMHNSKLATKMVQVSSLARWFQTL